MFRKFVALLVSVFVAITAVLFIVFNFSGYFIGGAYAIDEEFTSAVRDDVFVIFDRQASKSSSLDGLSKSEVMAILNESFDDEFFEELILNSRESFLEAPISEEGVITFSFNLGIDEEIVDKLVNGFLSSSLPENLPAADSNEIKSALESDFRNNLLSDLSTDYVFQVTTNPLGGVSTVGELLDKGGLFLNVVIGILSFVAILFIFILCLGDLKFLLVVLAFTDLFIAFVLYALIFALGDFSSILLNSFEGGFSFTNLLELLASRLQEGLFIPFLVFVSSGVLMSLIAIVVYRRSFNSVA